MFIPELRLRQPGFTYTTCVSLPKHYDKIKKSKKKLSLTYINC